MEELEERDLDALGDLIDEMFVAKAHPREIMKVLMEHEEQWNDVLWRVLRFARIYQLDFICRCTDAQIRVVARHAQTHTVVTDLCVWQVLQSGLPGYIKNLFRRGGAADSSRNHPWHGIMSDRLDDFETYMSSCPQTHRLSPGVLTEDFLKTTLWLSRIFQDDVFFSQDAENCRAMLDVVYRFPAEIELPFMAQLMERGHPQLKALIWDRKHAGRSEYARSALWDPRRDDFPSIKAAQFAMSAKYRRLFYDCDWMDKEIHDRGLPGHETISCRMLSESRSNPRIEELMTCRTYAEFEIRRSLAGTRLSNRLIERLTNDIGDLAAESHCLILTGLVENHLEEIEKFVSLERLTLKLIRRSCCESELEAFLRTVERLRPGLIKNFRDPYGGTMLNYLRWGAFTHAPIPFDDDPNIYEMLCALGCDSETALPNGCSIAELARYLRNKHADCFDFAQAVKL